MCEGGSPCCTPWRKFNSCPGGNICVQLCNGLARTRIFNSLNVLPTLSSKFLFFVLMWIFYHDLQLVDLHLDFDCGILSRKYSSYVECIQIFIIHVVPQICNSLQMMIKCSASLCLASFLNFPSSDSLLPYSEFCSFADPYLSFIPLICWFCVPKTNFPHIFFHFW